MIAMKHGLRLSTISKKDRPDAMHPPMETHNDPGLSFCDHLYDLNS